MTDDPDDNFDDSFHRVAVVGAGVMGAGIAAHLANAGVSVTLLDIAPGAAAAALRAMLRADPAPLMHPLWASRIAPGDLAHDLDQLAACDWIIEAVVERLEVKQQLYRQLDGVRRPGTPLSSNTSTLPLAQLAAGLPDSCRRDLLITHFFNPPRYMRLLELTAGPETDPAHVAAISRFADLRLGKTVVRCRDTPGFIANRIGAFWLQSALNHATDLGLSVAEADAAGGRPMGAPKTGVFGLLDLVGLDLMPHIGRSLAAHLPADDAYHAARRDHPVVDRLIAAGRTGRKAGGGFYRRVAGDDGATVKLAVDLRSGEDRPVEKPALDSLRLGKDLPAMAAHPDRGGRFIRAVLLDVLGYAAATAPDIADDVVAVDAALRLGYGWRRGPFELIDRLGPGWLAGALTAAGRAVPPLLRMAGTRPFYRNADDGGLQALGFDGVYRAVARPDGVLLLADVKRRGAPLAANGSASLWDIGERIACLEFHSKMNAIDPDVIAMIGQSIDIVGRDFRGLVIHNEGENFSVGANIGLALFAANIAAWEEIGGMVAAGQAALQALRAAPFPVVGAPSGLALGGGCEILLHCDAVQAHAETYMGLVEVGVGVIPAWGGCVEMLRRWRAHPAAPRGPMPAVMKAFEMISTATVAKSAALARDWLLLRPGDGITANRDRLLADARARALALAGGGYHPPETPPLSLPGRAGRAALDMAVAGFAALGRATPHDVTVCGRLAEALTGGDVDLTDDIPAADLLAGERAAFMALIRAPQTLARIEHMLTTGKPLRN